jgi:hypothetical protein
LAFDKILYISDRDRMPVLVLVDNTSTGQWMHKEANIAPVSKKAPHRKYNNCSLINSSHNKTARYNIAAPASFIVLARFSCHHCYLSLTVISILYYRSTCKRTADADDHNNYNLLVTIPIELR